MIRYEAQTTRNANAASATSCTVGSNLVMVTLRVKSPPVSKSVVRRMNPNHTLSSKPRLPSTSAETIRLGWASGHRTKLSRPSASSSALIRPTSWFQSNKSVSRGRHRAGQDANQRPGDLDADGADDDALNPLFGRER